MRRYQCGLKGPDPADARQELAYALQQRSGDLPLNLLQIFAWLREQGHPSCGGQGFANPCDAILGGPPWASAIGLWLDSQRRRGAIDVNAGTYLVDVARSLVGRGVDPYHDGEDHDITVGGWRINARGELVDSLSDELAAHDHRVALDAVNRSIDGSADRIIQGTREALAAGWAVVGGFGLRDSFFYYEPKSADECRVLNETDMGGSRNGHAMRIVGWLSIAGRIVFVLQNSWGYTWGGAVLPEHQYRTKSGALVTRPAGFYPGIALIEGSCVVDAWSRYAVELRLR